ncbi:PDZ domain-containing RING finger protein 4-like isoform X1 [Stigmatopora nigra]
MGCNLCTLRKREEHYKLLYEIAQVNRRHFSKVEQDENQEEAIRRDPVVVQVAQFQPLREKCVSDVCTQTDITFEHIMALAKLRPVSPPVPDVCPFLLSDSCHSIHTMQHEFYECPEYLSNIPAEVEQTGEYIYEEVELSKQQTHEKLGLTLCYRTDEEEEEDMGIYVSQVEPDSLAARDGRIKNGDRILRAPEERTTDTATCSSTSQDKDSGFGCSTDSPEHQPLLARLYRRSPAQCLREQWRAQNPHNRQSSIALSQDLLTENQGCESQILGMENHFQQLLEVKCQIRKGVECGVYSIRHSIECSLMEQGGGDGDSAEDAEQGEGVEQELRMLNEELRSIELECQNIMQNRQLHQTQETKRLEDIHEHPRSDKESSSPDHVAESVRSSPLGGELSPVHSLQRRVDLTNQRNLQIALKKPSRSLPLPKSQVTLDYSVQVDPCSISSSSPDQSNPSRSGSDPALPADDERCEKKRKTKDLKQRPQFASYQTSPYHGSLRSRQLQSYMQLLQQHSSLEYSQSQLSVLSVCRDPLNRGARSGEPRLEWKVKVRADGSRYVARRPARDRILRERALKIREERSGGLTTDDDAASELKMGRYWSKEERKQHLLRAREQRKRREFMQKSRFECLKEGLASGAEGNKEINILELSQKKMMKKRNKKILDNWMTIQELMSHGARVPEDSKIPNAFLSVTTV